MTGLGLSSPTNGESTGFIGSLFSEASSLASQYLTYKATQAQGQAQAQAMQTTQTTQMKTLMYIGLGVIALVIVVKVMRR